MDELFIGSAICEVTTGGEIVLPRHFHETIMSRSPDGRLFVGVHEESPCLVVYDRIFAAQQQWDLENRRSVFLGTNPEAHYARQRRAFGFVEHVTLAPDGMMILAPMMRQQGRIGNAALALSASISAKARLTGRSHGPSKRARSPFRSLCHASRLRS